MTTKGYTVNGTREMLAVGVEALQALQSVIDDLGEDAEVAEIRIYENMPVEVVVAHEYGFDTYVWTREAWVKAA